MSIFYKPSLFLFFIIFNLQFVSAQTSPTIHKPTNADGTVKTYQKSYKDNGTAPLTLPYTPHTDGTTAQKRIVVALVTNEYNTGSSIPRNTVTDVVYGGVSMTLIAKVTGDNNSLGNEIAAFYIKESHLNGSANVTLKYDSKTDPNSAALKSVGVEIFTVSNVNQELSIEQSLVSFNANRPATLSTATGITTEPGSLVLTAITSGDNGSTFSLPNTLTGYTRPFIVPFPNHSYASSYKNHSSVASEKPAFNMTYTGSGQYRVAMLAFRINPDIQASLPVNLVYFKARLNSGNIKLEWATAQEESNEKYIVERSSDSYTWSTVAEQKGAGNSSTRLNYSAIDLLPLPGINYYRLKQVDFDGTVTYSKVVAVNKLDSQEHQLTLHPNPAQGFANINLPYGEELTSVALISSSGKTIIPSFSQNNRTLILDLSALGSGLYNVKVETKQKVYSEKLMIK